MSIVPPLGVRGYLFQQQTPQVSKKKRYLFQLVESFFLWTSGGVAVTDSHPEPGSEEERREEGTGAYHGTVTQKVSPAFFSGVFLDLGQPKCANRDGWRLSNRQNTRGGGFFRAIFFLSTANFQLKIKEKNSAKKDTVAPTNAGSDRVEIANNTFFVFYCFFSKL